MVREMVGRLTAGGQVRTGGNGTDGVRASTAAAAPGPSRAAKLPAGTLLYLFLIGVVAIATIGAFFAAGFRLLALPAPQTIADFGAGDHGAPNRTAPAELGASPKPRDTAPPPPTAAVAALPSGAVVEPPTREDASPPPREKSAGPAPNAPASVAAQAAANTTGAEDARPPADDASAAADKPSAATQGRTRTTARHSRSAHHYKRLERAQRAASHDQQRILSEAMDRAHRERLTDTGQSLTPPREKRRRSFDELLTGLTGEAKPADRSLTPPAPGLPDPFAQPRPATQ